MEKKIKSYAKVVKTLFPGATDAERLHAVKDLVGMDLHHEHTMADINSTKAPEA